jgi:hypothetical protein
LGVALALIAPVVVEQIHRPMAYDKAMARARVTEIANIIPQDIDAFLLTTTDGPQDRFVHEDAMWVSFSAGVPTVNGRYGKKPGKCWQLRDVHYGNRRKKAKIRANLDQWIECQDLNPERIAWVSVRARPAVVK